MGWSNFQGGSEAASGCLGNIPPGDINFPVGGSNQFWCDSNIYFVDVQFDGGVIPVVWATNIGQISVTGARTARVKIHSAVNSPIVFFGTNSTVCGNPVIASLRLGKQLAGKNVSGECTFFCGYEDYGCADEWLGYFPGGAPGSALPGNPENCLPFDPGNCMSDEKVVSDFPDIFWNQGGFPDSGCAHPDYPDCGHGVYCGPYQTAPNSDTVELLFQSLSTLQDVRHPNLIAAGCSPCSQVRSLDVVVTAIDAAGNVVIQDIHIN